MNETLSKYLSHRDITRPDRWVIAYALTNQVLFIEAGPAVGIVIGASR